MSACIKDVFCFVAEPIKKYVVDQLILIGNVGENVEAIAREAAILENRLKDVQDRIQKDEAEGKKPTATVQGWLEKLNKLQPSATAQSLQTDYDTRNCMLWGTCSLNCFSSRSISKRAVDMLKLLHEESEFIKGVQNYTEEGPRPPVQLMSAMPIQFGREMFETRLQEALNFLGDDHRSVLGICGMGGVGKTTLLELINNKLGENSSSLGFDKVVFVTASRESTTKEIQKKLVQTLGLRKEDEDNYRTQIFNYLSNKSFAILLDDVWERQDLKEIGVPLPLGAVDGDQHKLTKRKLIITTRSYQVCSNMGAKKTINVECLSAEDARLLFRDNAGVDATSIRCNPLIGELADKVADECGGLPIALITIGQAMAGTETVPVWENALELLRTSKLSQIPGMDDPLPLLKYSYDCLKDPREKECLLHCALWPEDYDIRKDHLIQCWMGHGLLGKFDSVHKAYNTGHAIIDNLLKVCLLEDVKDEYTLKNKMVKLHDIIRDMVLWIARGCSVENDKKFVVLNGSQVKRAPCDKQTWSEVHKMSLINTDISTWPSEIQNCPNLTTLIVNYNRHLSSMSILKHSRALKYLDLSSCWGLKVFPIEVCGLSNLEYLNLSDTEISSLPEELKNLTNLKYLLLQKTGISTIPVEVLSNLVNLLELDLFHELGALSHSSIIDHLHCLEGHLNALGINASSLLDFEKLAHLSGISIRALCVQRMEKLDSPSLGILSPKLLGSQNIYSSLKTLVIADLDEGLKELVIEERCRLMDLDSLDIIDAAGLKEIIWRGVKPAEVFPKIREMSIKKCHQMRHVTWISNLPCLERLLLIDCDNMEHLLVREGGAEAEESSSRLFFPSLRILVLRSLKKLSCIYDHALVFPALEYLGVRKCPQLMKLPFESPACCRNLKMIRAQKQW